MSNWPKAKFATSSPAGLLVASRARSMFSVSRARSNSSARLWLAVARDARAQTRAGTSAGTRLNSRRPDSPAAARSGDREDLADRGDFLRKGQGQVGRGSCTDIVCQYVSITVRHGSFK